MASRGFSITQQLKNTNGLKTNHEDEKIIGRFGSKANFQLDVDIRRTSQEPIFQRFGKSMYEVEWINRDGPSIVLLKIEGAKAKKEAPFYVELSSHPHIVRTYGLVSSNPGSIMLLQERASQGNLSELLCENEFKPSERVLWDIFQQICDAMIFLADKSIIHGNLTCQNVLVFQMNPINPKKNLVKLTDFGLTKVSKLYSVINSPTLTTMTTIPARYAAPELLQYPKKLDYSEKSDIYSMGVLMWEACSYGKLPYSDIDDNERVRQKKLKDEKLPQPSLCSDDLWTIINECWQQKPKKRPNFQSLKQFISDLQSKSIIKSEWEVGPHGSSDPSVISSQLNKADNLRYGGYEDCREQHDNTEIAERSYDRYYNDAEILDSHETADFQNGSASCPFCQKNLLSSMDARDHLIQCGTKTDQCPNCQKFIQRAIFAYHYENNCATINEIERSNGLDNPSSHHSSRILPHNSNERTQSAKPNIHTSPKLLDCEFCHNQCAQNDYETHKDHCLYNPANGNNDRQQRSAQSHLDKRHSSNEFVVIPCEYCQEKYAEGELRLHEVSCLKNPNGRASSSRSTQNRPSPTRSVHSTTSPELDEDTTHLSINEASGFPAPNPKSPSVDEYTDRYSNEHSCCCCS